MKRLLFVFALTLTVFTLSSQTSKEAEVLLKEVIDFYDKGGVEMEVGVDWGNDGSGFISTLKMDKECFCFSFFENAIWFDGKTQWYYRSIDEHDGTGELYISEPTEDELETINPFCMMKNWKKNYTAAITKNLDRPKGTPNAAYHVNPPAYGIILTNRNPKAEVISARILLDKDKHVCNIFPTLQNGMQVRVEIYGAKNGLQLDKKTFKCDLKIDSDTEVIDMR